MMVLATDQKARHSADDLQALAKQVIDLLQASSSPHDASFKTALELADGLRRHIDAWPDIGIVLAGFDRIRGDQQAVEAAMRDVLAAEPSNVQAHKWLTSILADEERWEELGEAAVRYRRADPYSPDAMEKTLLGLLLTDQAGRAVAEVERTLAADPAFGFNRIENFIDVQSRCIAMGLPAIMFNTQPKSGTAFVGDTLRAGLGLARCRMDLPGEPGALVTRQLLQFAKGGSLCTQHFPAEPAILDHFRRAGLTRFCVHIRDPRQSLLSLVHTISPHAVEQSYRGALIRARHPEGFASWPLQRQIDHYLDTRFEDQARWQSDWLAVTRDGNNGLDIRVSTFETLKLDNRRFLEELLDFFDIDREVFDWEVVKQPRVAGDMNFRKGETDEWKQVFTPQQKQDALEIMRRVGIDLYG